MITRVNSLTTALVRRSSREAGFTLVELMVSLIVFGIILAAIYGIWFGLQRTYAFTEDDLSAQSEARAALNEMVELIRTARQPDTAPWEALRSTLVYADSTTLIFWSDADRDANHDLELIRYRVNITDRTLYRDLWDISGTSFVSGSSARLVGRWVSNGTSLPLFQYEDANSQPLASPVSDPMAIRTITISLRVDVTTEKAPIAHVLSSVVQPRNLR
jgi:prepilin-type N-terminal cleavage/methylation domain-containing protein